MHISKLLIIVILISCHTTSKEGNSIQNDLAENETLGAEEYVEDSKLGKPLYLNGIYEYDYPHDTKDMNENQYIAFEKENDSIRAWYFGTSDEFDVAREGYLPGYFVSEIQDLSTDEDSIFFKISTGFEQCYSDRFPIGYVDKVKLNKEFKKWYGKGETQTVKYSGKLDGLNLYIMRFGETRVYRKTKNYFHVGIDNYDPTKCQSNPLLSVNRNINKLNEEVIFDFLSTFSVICEANAEFGEFSNELLFKVLLASPKLVLNVLSKNSNSLDTVSIFRELESPIHDLIPIDSIINKIKPLIVDRRTKNSVLKRLENLK